MGRDAMSNDKKAMTNDKWPEHCVVCSCWTNRTGVGAFRSTATSGRRLFSGRAVGEGDERGTRRRRRFVGNWGSSYPIEDDLSRADSAFDGGGSTDGIGWLSQQATG